jgi:hypothetical protein
MGTNFDNYNIKTVHVMTTVTISTDRYYPGLTYPSDSIQGYLRSGSGLFVLSLKNCAIARFFPSDIAHFEEWLESNQIRSIQ